MAATVTTKENFPKGTKEARMKKAQELRLKAGAITSKYTGSETKGWVLTTKWNVIGQQ